MDNMKKEYRCPNGHTSWIKRARTNDYKCIQCGWTGPTLVDWTDNIRDEHIIHGKNWDIAVKIWLKDTGISEFKYCDLPNNLKNWKMFQQAGHRGHIKAMIMDEEGRRTWKVI